MFSYANSFLTPLISSARHSISGAQKQEIKGTRLLDRLHQTKVTKQTK
jgi:hypothetical protein